MSCGRTGTGFPGYRIETRRERQHAAHLAELLVRAVEEAIPASEGMHTRGG